MESIARELMPHRHLKKWIALGILVLSGCAPESLYFWGEYEDLIYHMYNKPGSADTSTQIAKLREDIGKAGEEGKPVPPGVHAHLGYMYYLQGDTNAAAIEFATEKKLFPEATTFIDGLTNRIKK